MNRNENPDSRHTGAASSGAAQPGALLDSHGSGSPVCDPKTAASAVAVGTTAATSAAPVMAISSHRSGETLQVSAPILHYGSDTSGSGSSFLTPARRSRSRGT